MNDSQYTEYLQSDKWQELRQWKFTLVGHHCFNCGFHKGLHVHHVVYRNLIDCTPDDLIVLCESCHNDLHLLAKRDHRPLETITEENIKQLLSEFRNSTFAVERQGKLLKRNNYRADRTKFTPGFNHRKCRLWKEVKRFVGRTRSTAQIPGCEINLAAELKDILKRFGYYP